MYNEKKPFQPFYNSANWKQIRLIKLSQQPLCEVCLKNDLINPADQVHHIISLSEKEGWRKRLDIDNLQSICIRCHQLESTQTRQKNIRKKGEILMRMLEGEFDSEFDSEIDSEID